MMDIIGSWVDEEHVRELANQLTRPQVKNAERADEDFVIVSPEEIFVEHVGNKRRSEQAEPPNIQKNNAVRALEAAAQKASQSGVVSPKVAVETKSKTRVKHDIKHGISSELSNHLGESGGAMVDRNAVTSSLDVIVEMLKRDWNTQEVSISDRDGDMFVDRMRSPKLSHLTVSVTEPIRLLDIRQGAIGHGYMHLKITARELLQVVVTSTSQGLLVIGMIRKKRLNAVQAKELVDQIRELV